MYLPETLCAWASHRNCAKTPTIDTTHALSVAPSKYVFSRGNTQRQLVVSLLPELEFLAKNQLPSQAPEWISVPGIALLNPSKAERILCPVRQLNLYLRDSERIRGGCQRMFIHWNRNIRDIMRSHISRWIMETVKEAYTRAEREYDRVTAHEVGALSASWAYNCQVALPDILSAAFWRLSGVFQNSYLRDMACIADGMSTLGPVVVVQQVMDPGYLPPPWPTWSVCSHCYDVLNGDYLIISWYLHVWNGVVVARNPPAYPAKERSLGENLVTDWRIPCSAQVRLRTEAGM